MSLTLAQIFALNPTATVAATDLFYLVQSPYTPGTDAAILGSNLKNSLGPTPGLAIYVSTNGNDITGNGTIVQPYATYEKARTVAILTASASIPYVIRPIGIFNIAGDMTLSPFVNVNGYDNYSSGFILTGEVNLDPAFDTTANAECHVSNVNIVATGNINLTFNAFQAAVIHFDNCDFSGTSALNVTGAGLVNNTELILIENCVSINGSPIYTFTNVLGALANSTAGNGIVSINNSAITDNTCILINLYGPTAAINFITTSTGTQTIITSAIFNFGSSLTIDGANNNVLIDASSYMVTPTYLNGATAANITLISLSDGIEANTNFTPSNYTPTAGVNFKANSVTGNLAGIDAAMASFGTVSSISSGTGITLTPNPITTTGTVGLTIPVAVTSGGTGLITTTINQILYSSAANTIAGLSTANNGLLVTSNTGVPSILAGPGTTGNVLQSNAAAAPSFSTATYPSTATNAARILRADGTNWVQSTSTFADIYAASSLLYANGANNVAGLTTVNRALLSTNATGVPTWLALTDGQIVIGSTAGSPAAASLTQGAGITITPGSNSISIAAASGAGSPLTTKGDIYTFSTVNDRLPVATGNGKVLQVSSGAATGLAYSTPTYPSASGSSGTILRSDGTNNVYSTSTFADTYAINTILYNASANTVSGLATANSSILVTSAGGVPSWSTTLPAFTTTTITFNPSTGGLVGTTTNNNATAGIVGEFVSSVISFGSAVTMTNGVNRDITSISVTAGDWDINGSVVFVSTSTTAQQLLCWSNTTSATFRTDDLLSGVTIIGGSNQAFGVPYLRVSVSGTTTVYLSGLAAFTTGGVTAFGQIVARRVR